MSVEAYPKLTAIDLLHVPMEMLAAEVRRRINNGAWSAYAGDSVKQGLYGSEQWDDEVRDAAHDQGVLTALAYWRRGDKREALHQLENALGRDWIGLGDLKPEDLA